MKIKVNQDACIGCGACTAIAEGVFNINDDGLSEVVGEVTEDKVDAVKEAIESCPTSAIVEVTEEEK